MKKLLQSYGENVSADYSKLGGARFTVYLKKEYQSCIFSCYLLFFLNNTDYSTLRRNP